MYQSRLRSATPTLLALFLAAACFGAGPLSSTAADGGPQAALAGTKSAGSDEPPPALTAEQIAKARADVAARQEQTARKLADATQRQAPAWLATSLRFEADQLRFLALILTQQEVLLENQAELAGQLRSVSRDPSQWMVEEIDARPPYSFLLLEQLLDDRADAQARNELFDLEIDTARSLVEQAKLELQRKNRERRRLQEALSAAHEAAARLQVDRRLVIAELGCRIGQELLTVRQLGLDVKTLERDYEALRDETLAGAVATVAANAPFTRQDLDDKLAQLGRTESELRQRLSRLQNQLHPNGVVAGMERPGETASTSAAAESERRDLIRRAMSQINESLADLVILRFAWNQRFRVANGTATAEERSKLLDQLGTFRGHFLNSRRVQELRLKEARLGLPPVEAEAAVAADAPRAQLTRMLLDVGEARAGLLQEAGRMIDRFHDELTSQSRAHTFTQSAVNFLPVIQDWWFYEVLVVDDRPITIGKMVIAALMLLGGLLLSRHLSRMIGKRMLPRFGIHEGASMALQTIAFYSMTVVCGFITLDMLNIPLTVFTFLGGAAAIAVGFGSQNILNNFLSGLIILGEQPIRVGDLVEIDGLHANIEHIGTRSTRVRTGSNLEIIVPNSRFLENNVTNWTLSDNEIRVSVTVGVAYGSPVDDVLVLLRETVRDEPQALNDPEPIVLFNGFGDNSLDFEVHFWVRMRTHMQGRRVQSEVRRRIDASFRAAGIVIAFPQRDVHLDTDKPLQIALSQAPEISLAPGVRRAA